MQSIDLAARITEYRVRAGLRQQDLAQAAGLDRTALAKIENGQRRVTALELDALANALEIRIDWFFELPAEALVAYRSALDPEAPTSSMDQLVESASRNASLVLDLAEESFPPLVGEPRELRGRTDAESFAASARGWMGVSRDEPLMHIGDVAVKAGILTFTNDLGPNAPEAASLVGASAGVAVVNGHLRVGRRRLAAAHEIGHLLTRDGYRVDWRIDAPDQQEWETRLDQFARALLLPERALQIAWARSYEGGIREAAIRVASEYQVDMATLSRRLLDLDLASSAEANSIRQLRTSRSDIISFDLVVREDLVAPYAPRAYQQAVLRLYQADRLSSDRTADLLMGTLSEADLPARPPLPENAAWSLL